MYYLWGAFVVVLFFTLLFLIGYYVALPIFLVCMIVSAVTALIRAFVPERAMKHPKTPYKSSTNPKIIDVDFEEIK